MTQRTIVGLLLVLSLQLLPSASAQEVDKVVNKKRILGHWTVVYMERYGRPDPEMAKKLRMEIYPTHMKLIQDSLPATKVGYYADMRNNPGDFSWTQHGYCRVLRQAGIYQIEQDTLTICVGQVDGPAPSSFQSPHYFGQTLFVMKRTPFGPAVTLPTARPDKPLGVFSLSSSDQDRIDSVLTLYTNAQGDLAGELYYVASKQRLPVVGRVDTTAQQVQLAVGADQAVRLGLPVAGLTVPNSQVSVQIANQPPQTWRINRLFTDGL